MPEEGVRALEREVRGRVPGGVRKLGDAELRDLADAVADARHRQAAELQAAGEKALNAIPGVLRGPIRRMFR